MFVSRSRVPILRGGCPQHFFAEIVDKPVTCGQILGIAESDEGVIDGVAGQEMDQQADTNRRGEEQKCGRAVHALKIGSAARLSQEVTEM